MKIVLLVVTNSWTFHMLLYNMACNLTLITTITDAESISNLFVRVFFFLYI
jgi:hypothetical protein